MLPSFDSGEDAGWVGGPDEGFGVGIGFLDEAVDGGLQVDDRAEHTALQAPPGELGEEARHRVQPGGRGRREVERPAWMPGEPGAHFRMLVGSVVVDDGMDNTNG